MARMKAKKTPEQAAADLAESLEQAYMWFNGDDSKVTVHTFEIEVPDVAKLRKKLKLTQEGFATMLGIPVTTLRNWEQGRRYPTGPARKLLSLIEKRPELVLDLEGVN